LAQRANSGSEAILLCLWLARGYTRREKIVRIDGHFHGGQDYVLSNNLAHRIDVENPGDRSSRIGR
jgi:glutamate-1-semialdehyde 2,1-aminomutase